MTVWEAQKSPDRIFLEEDIFNKEINTTARSAPAVVISLLAEFPSTDVTVTAGAFLEPWGSSRIPVCLSLAEEHRF